MDEEQNGSKNILKSTIKLFSFKWIFIFIIIVLVLIILSAGYYIIDKDSFEDLSEKTSTYSGTVSPSGTITYTQTDSKDGNTKNPVTSDDIAEDLKPELDNYIDVNSEDYKKFVEYVIGAEAVTKLPYMDAAESNGITGCVKFYRYTDAGQANNAIIKDTNGSESLNNTYRLTYKTPEEFKKLKENYVSKGETEVFKHFTLSNNGEVIIAYGTQETNTIITKDAKIEGVDYAADYELTLEKIKEVSGEQNYSGNSKDGFSISKYSIEEKKIDYLSLVEQYVMPQNFLWALLAQTQDEYFVKAIAELAYNSEIAVGIYDNENYTEENEEYVYNKVMKINGQTSLDFSNLSTSLPVITESSLKDSKYSNVPISCSFEVHEGNCTHTQNYQGSTATTTESSVNMYVAKTSNGKVLTLGTKDEAQLFKVNYKKTATGQSEPSVGVILADTWVAEWRAKYSVQEVEDSSSVNGKNEDALIMQYSTNDQILNIFDTNMQSSINNQLTTHVDKLKEAAIAEIMSNTDFTTIINKPIKGDKNQPELFGPTETEEPEYSETTLEKKSRIEKTLKEQIKINSTVLTGTNTYTNITYAESKYEKSTKYNKSGTTEIDKAGEKFANIFNSRTYHDAKYELLATKEWFFEKIRANEDTAKLEDVIRMLLNTATFSSNTGTNSNEEIEDILSAFEPKGEVDTSLESGVTLLMQYVRYFENGSVQAYLNGASAYSDYVAKYISKDKKYYYIRDDGVGNPTVGFGIDIFNGGFVQKFLDKGYTEAQLRDTSGKVSVPVEFVDSLEALEINQAMTAIKEKTSGLNLKTYQVYALVSRAYNCGISGAINGYGEMDFIEAYTTYFNPKKDINYGDISGDFTHGLYTKFMCQPTTASGKYLEGLEKRRKSEWTLFQTGYMDSLNKFVD